MTDPHRDSRDGLISAVIAYTIWGFLPIYFLVIRSVASDEVLMHRIIWAVPFGAIIIHFRQQWPEVLRAVRDRATLAWLAVAAVFIAVNWFIYIVAVQHDNIFQASLGYYINPLIYVLVGVAFMGERLRRMQLIAVVFASVGVIILTISGGQFPFISAAIAISFTVYGVIRKRVVVGGMPGLFIETLVLLPFAAVWLIWMMLEGGSSFAAGGYGLKGLLLLAGPVTVVPLLFFALAARRLPLSTLGFLQFIGPSLQFVVGVVYGEELSSATLICFAFVWLGVIIFSLDAMYSSGRKAVGPAS
jgi:chloramphenicol-sensitive protein RarD